MTFESYYSHFKGIVLSQAYSLGKGNIDLREDLIIVGKEVIYNLYTRLDDLTLPEDSFVFQAVRNGMYKAFRRTMLLNNLHAKNSNGAIIPVAHARETANTSFVTQLFKCPYHIPQVEYNIIYNIVYKGYTFSDLVDRYRMSYPMAKKICDKVNRNREWFEHMLVWHA